MNTFVNIWFPSRRFSRFCLAASLAALLLSGCNSGPASVKEAGRDSLLTEMKNPVILEIVADSGQLNSEKLSRIAGENLAHQPVIYEWANHMVIFDDIIAPEKLQALLSQDFPGARVRVYQQPFYHFSRKLCNPSASAKEWDHYLLTANLVADTALQQQYLGYHARQFTEWPDVARGFCNAGFQQLLVFRNGRQLMLVISVEKGKTLDELNPKTTQNNPKMVEWNELMKKYQEGLPGTAKGEVWVFLKPVRTGGSL